MSEQESKRMIAALLAFFLGAFGVHKFYLGYTKAGVIQLVLSLCTGLGALIGLIEFIIYLTKSDAEFIETYQVGQKEWF
jgi:TM2 domain-containing membrane protein YozV